MIWQCIQHIWVNDDCLWVIKCTNKIFSLRKIYRNFSANRGINLCEE